MTFVDRPLPEDLKLPQLREPKPRDKRLDNLRVGIGRIPGTQNKICRDLKEGLLEGAIRHGYDGNGLDGLVGYCHHLAERYPKTYGYLLGKLLPYNFNANVASAAINEVRIISIPSGQHYSSADLRRIEQGQDTIDALPQLERRDEPAALEPAPHDDADISNLPMEERLRRFGCVRVV
jgi:hypothetical protein